MAVLKEPHRNVSIGIYSGLYLFQIKQAIFIKSRHFSPSCAPFWNTVYKVDDIKLRAV